MTDNVNQPKHYTSHPSGIECIQITEHMNFCLGNALKYIWRADLKNDVIEDLEKAKWYIEREIALRKKEKITEYPPPIPPTEDDLFFPGQKPKMFFTPSPSISSGLPDVLESTVDAFARLENWSAKDLSALGMTRLRFCSNDADLIIWLFPEKLYDFIPEGLLVYDIQGRPCIFRKGRAMSCSTNGALHFGIRWNK